MGEVEHITEVDDAEEPRAGIIVETVTHRAVRLLRTCLPVIVVAQLVQRRIIHHVLAAILRQVERVGIGLVVTARSRHGIDTRLQLHRAMGLELVDMALLVLQLDVHSLHVRTYLQLTAERQFKGLLGRTLFDDDVIAASHLVGVLEDDDLIAGRNLTYILALAQEEQLVLLVQQTIDSDIVVGTDVDDTLGYIVHLVVADKLGTRLYGEGIDDCLVVLHTNMHIVLTGSDTRADIDTVVGNHFLAVQTDRSRCGEYRQTYRAVLLHQLGDVDDTGRSGVELMDAVLPTVETGTAALDGVHAVGQRYLDRLMTTQHTVHPYLRLFLTRRNAEHRVGGRQLDIERSDLTQTHGDHSLIGLVFLLANRQTVGTRLGFYLADIGLQLVVQFDDIAAHVGCDLYLAVVLRKLDGVAAGVAAQQAHRFLCRQVERRRHTQVVTTDTQFGVERTCFALLRLAAVDGDEIGCLLAVEVEELTRTALLGQSGGQLGAIDITGLQRHAVVAQRLAVLARDSHLTHIGTDPNPYLVLFVLTFLDLLCAQLETEEGGYGCLETQQRTAFTVLIEYLRGALRQVFDIVLELRSRHGIVLRRQRQAAEKERHQDAVFRKSIHHSSSDYCGFRPIRGRE